MKILSGFYYFCCLFFFYLSIYHFILFFLSLFPFSLFSSALCSFLCSYLLPLYISFYHHKFFLLLLFSLSLMLYLHPSKMKDSYCHKLLQFTVCFIIAIVSIHLYIHFSLLVYIQNPSFIHHTSTVHQKYFHNIS